MREFLPLPVQQAMGIDKDRFSMAVEVEKDVQWDRRGGWRTKEWISSDRTRRILIIEHGGPEYSGMWMKDIHLSSRGELANGELMRVQEVIKADGTVEHNVYLDVTIDREEGKWPVEAHASYSSRNNGKLDPFHSWSGPMKRGEYEKMPEEEFEALWRNEMTLNGFRHASELPAFIDIDATVLGFINQIQQGDFSKPVLVERYPGEEEIEAVEVNARQRLEASKLEDQLSRQRREEEKQRRERTIYRRAARKVEGYLPSGRARQRGTEFANRFEQIGPQLKELDCSVNFSGYMEVGGKSSVDIIKLEVDKNNAQAVEDLLEQAGIEIDRDPLFEEGRLSALRTMHNYGLTDNEQFADQLRIKEFVIFQGKHLSDQDAKRIQFDVK